MIDGIHFTQSKYIYQFDSKYTQLYSSAINKAEKEVQNEDDELLHYRPKSLPKEKCLQIS